MARINKKIKAAVNIVAVVPKDVHRFWPLAEFMIAEALAYSGKYADAKHIYELLLKDQMQLFIMFGSDEFEENKVFGVCVTRVAAMPNYNQLEIVICTGKRRELWEDKIVAHITNFAKTNDCKRLCVWARPGWEKVSKKWGWKKKHVQLVKDVK
jgi:esterase/lipase superfamily enzyme